MYCVNLYCCLAVAPAVGKTSLITRFMYDSFDNTYQVEFCVSFCWFLSVISNTRFPFILGNDWHRFSLKNNVPRRPNGKAKRLLCVTCVPVFFWRPRRQSYVAEAVSCCRKPKWLSGLRWMNCGTNVGGFLFGSEREMRGWFEDRICEAWGTVVHTHSRNRSKSKSLLLQALLLLDSWSFIYFGSADY